MQDDRLTKSPASAFDDRMLPVRIAAAVACLLLLTVADGKIRAEGDWAAPDTVITMLRGGCERRCPVYLVVIFADGTVIVQGEHYLRKPVLAKSEIRSADVRRLVERFKALDYFRLPDAFGYKGTGCTSFGNYDGPVVTTTIVTKGAGKSLQHHHGSLGAIPDQLTALEGEIDETAHTARALKGALPR